MRILFALPGLHRFDRGAEVALISVASELAKLGNEVKLIGSGNPRTGKPYSFLKAASISRKNFENFANFPPLRSDTAYEELSFVPDLLRRYSPGDYDITVTCSYPFTNWVLRRPTLFRRPKHVFVTQNGDWPSTSNRSEYRFFGCDGLVCTNPDYFWRNEKRWNCALIPNGVDTHRFIPGKAERMKYGLKGDRPIVLMVSALIETKRVREGIESVSKIPDLQLLVAGDGPLRDEIDRLGQTALPGRFKRISVAPEEMPALYQAADAFLHMSIEESFGNVFVEAMACGLPIVGHDTNRLRWIVGEDEYLTETTNIALVSDAIERALREPLSKRSQRVQRAQKFSWESIGLRYRDFFDSLIAG